MPEAHAAQPLGQEPLVPRVPPGVQEGDGGRIHARGEQAARLLLQAAGIQRLEDPAVGADPLVDLDHMAGQRLRPADVQVEEAGTLLRPDRQQVGEAPRDEERHPPPRAFQ